MPGYLAMLLTQSKPGYSVKTTNFTSPGCLMEASVKLPGIFMLKQESEDFSRGLMPSSAAQLSEMRLLFGDGRPVRKFSGSRSVRKPPIQSTNKSNSELFRFFYPLTERTGRSILNGPNIREAVETSRNQLERTSCPAISLPQ